jgi:hypothetical protein
MSTINQQETDTVAARSDSLNIRAARREASDDRRMTSGPVGHRDEL